MSTTGTHKNGLAGHDMAAKSIAELDAAIAELEAQKQAIEDARMHELIDQLARDCAELGTTPTWLAAMLSAGPPHPRADNDE